MSFFFVSYKRRERYSEDFLDELIGFLAKFNIGTWTDREIGIKEWIPEIDDHIKDSAGVIVIMTPAANKSQYITYEWAFGLGLDKPIIPIRLERSHPDPNHPKYGPIHPRLAAINYLDFSYPDEQPWGNLLDELRGKQSINMVLPSVQKAYDKLMGASKDERNAGLDDLFENDSPQADEFLVKAYHSPEMIQASVKYGAALTLAKRYVHGKSSSLHPEAVSMLIETYDNWHDIDAKQSAIFYLGELRSNQATPKLLEILQYPDAGFRSLAATALSKVKDPEAFDGLVQALDDDYFEVIGNSAIALAETDAEAALPHLHDVFAKFKSLDIGKIIENKVVLASLQNVMKAFGITKDPDVFSIFIYAINWIGRSSFRDFVVGEIVSIGGEEARQAIYKLQIMQNQDPHKFHTAFKQILLDALTTLEAKP